ncbi:DUF4384 domain-containing protein [Candidatus Poribacteria bacterium]|nr:DUF4384 domain-containing protein [Candidatus Poribacteria bacterium]
MRSLFLLSILIFALVFSCLADNFTNEIARLVEEISLSAEWNNYPVAIGLGNFFYADSKMSSEFGYHLATEIEVAISNISQFVLVNRRNLGEILNEQGFQLTDLVDPNTAKKPGKIRGLDALLTGSYSIWEKKVRVKVEFIRIEDAKMMAFSRLVDDIPKNVEIKPPNYEVQALRIEKIKDFFEEPDANKEKPRSDFHITIEPEKTDAYKDGDELKLFVKSDIDCYIEIDEIAPDGTITTIFPNQYNENTFIKANTRTPIPNDSSFRFIITEPFGMETIKIKASNKKFEYPNNPAYKSRGAFSVLGNIDDDKTLEYVKFRASSVFSRSTAEEPVIVAQNYCTILTQSLEP